MYYLNAEKSVKYSKNKNRLTQVEINHQYNIYDFLGVENDPIFNAVEKLEIGHSYTINHITIKLNEQEIYEIETKGSHDAFASQKQVYDHLSYMFSLEVE